MKKLQFLRVATHNGLFHADDVVAVSILELATNGAYSLVRTRDPALLANADVVVDVGGEYDPARGRFDHHQKGRAGARPNGVLYSSAGLVWKEYGVHVCGDPQIVEMVDRSFIAPIDAIDNGQELTTGGELAFEGVRPLGFSGLISGMNPTWQERADTVDARFQVAVGVAKTFLCRAVQAATAALEAKEIVEEAVASTTDAVMILEGFAPWQEHLLANPRGSNILYVVFPSIEGTWMVQAVPDRPGSFNNRKALPEAWAGLRDGDLAALTGVKDAVFTHPGRFIGGAKSRGGAIRLAELAAEA